MFEFGGKNPAIFEILKNTTIFGVIILLAIFWYQLGVTLGMIKTSSYTLEDVKTDDFSDRVDVDANFTGQFDIVDDENLLEQLQKSIKEKSSLNGTKDFLCCLVLKNPISTKYEEKLQNDDDNSSYKKLRCYGLSTLKSNSSEFHERKYTRKIARLRSATSALDCENGSLVYQLSIAND